MFLKKKKTFPILCPTDCFHVVKNVTVIKQMSLLVWGSSWNQKCSFLPYLNKKSAYTIKLQTKT